MRTTLSLNKTPFSKHQARKAGRLSAAARAAAAAAAAASAADLESVTDQSQLDVEQDENMSSRQANVESLKRKADGTEPECEDSVRFTFVLQF